MIATTSKRSKRSNNKQTNTHLPATRVGQVQQPQPPQQQDKGQQQQEKKEQQEGQQEQEEQQEQQQQQQGEGKHEHSPHRQEGAQPATQAKQTTVERRNAGHGEQQQQLGKSHSPAPAVTAADLSAAVMRWPCEMSPGEVLLTVPNMMVKAVLTSHVTTYQPAAAAAASGHATAAAASAAGTAIASAARTSTASAGDTAGEVSADQNGACATHQQQQQQGKQQGEQVMAAAGGGSSSKGPVLAAVTSILHELCTWYWREMTGLQEKEQQDCSGEEKKGVRQSLQRVGQGQQEELEDRQERVGQGTKTKVAGSLKQFSTSGKAAADSGTAQAAGPAAAAAAALSGASHLAHHLSTSPTLHVTPAAAAEANAWAHWTSLNTEPQSASASAAAEGVGRLHTTTNFTSSSSSSAGFSCLDLVQPLSSSLACLQTLERLCVLPRRSIRRVDLEGEEAAAGAEEGGGKQECVLTPLEMARQVRDKTCAL